MSIIWPEDDPAEGGHKNPDHVTTLTGRYETDEDSENEGVSYKELANSYRELHKRNEGLIKTTEK
jgi:hypothetical protein